MKRAAIIVVVFQGAMVVSGCGTVMNLRDGPTNFDGPEKVPASPFGGVSRDVYWGYFSLATSIQYPQTAVLGLGLIADIPLSVIGDIVTLPVVLTRTPPNPDQPDPSQVRPDRVHGGIGKPPAMGD